MNDRWLNRTPRLLQASLILVVAAAFLGMSRVADVPPLASNSPMQLGAAQASGWIDAPHATTDGDALYARTSTKGTTLTISGFEQATPRGPITGVTLRLDQAQASHLDDRLTVAASSSGCSPLGASPSASDASGARSTLSTTLTCQGGWTWAKLSGLSATVTATAVGGGLLSSGVDGEWRIYFASIAVTYTDDPPVVAAGLDQTVEEGVIVQMQASATDAEGPSMKLAWTQTSGLGVDLSSTTTLDPTFRAPTLTTNQDKLIVLRFSATDADDQTTSDSVTITVRHANRPPVADAGSDQEVETGDGGSLLGSGSDPDGDSLTYQWTQSSGSPVELRGARTATASFTAPDGATTLVFSLRATDSLGLQSTADQVTVTVVPSPPAPSSSTGSSTAGSTSTSSSPSGSSSSGSSMPTGSTSPTASTTTTSASSTAASTKPTSSSSTRTISEMDSPIDGEGALVDLVLQPGPSETGECSHVVKAHNTSLRFPAACGITAATLEASADSGDLDGSLLRIMPLALPPLTIPAPPGAATGFVDIKLVAPDGSKQVAALRLRLPVPADWVASVCPPPACSILVWHYHAGQWHSLEATRMAEADGWVEYEFVADNFSLFGVGAPVSPEATNTAWWTHLGWMSFAGAAVLGTGTLATVAVARRKRRARWIPTRGRIYALPAEVPMLNSPPASATTSAEPASREEKVDRLLREMKTNENLVQFVNNAAHDLANPLTPIQLQLHMLMAAAQGKDDERGQKALRIVKRNVDQLAMLILDLKDASRLQAGHLRLTKIPVDLAKVAADAAETMRAQVEAAGLRFTVESEEALVVEADAGRLTQVLTNFITNAMKFTASGGQVRVIVTREDGSGLILIRDTGLGLSPQDREKLFQPFSQVHGEVEKKKGTGLGLFISKGIVEGHGGEIGCTSDGPGKGSTFWFSIPLKP